MLLQLGTGRVAGYTEGQEPLIYLKSSVQAVVATGRRFVFSDGHGIAAYTTWFDDLARLDQVDWDIVYLRYWKDDVDHMDCQRRKQAEFLIHEFCPWALVDEIAVLNPIARTRVETIMNEFDTDHRKLVNVRAGWYY
jgi:hypothetical protein